MADTIIPVPTARSSRCFLLCRAADRFARTNERHAQNEKKSFGIEGGPSLIIGGTNDERGRISLDLWSGEFNAGPAAPSRGGGVACYSFWIYFDPLFGVPASLPGGEILPALGLLFHQQSGTFRLTKAQSEIAAAPITRDARAIRQQHRGCRRDQRPPYTSAGELGR